MGANEDFDNAMRDNLDAGRDPYSTEGENLPEWVQGLVHQQCPNGTAVGISHAGCHMCDGSGWRRAR